MVRDLNYNESVAKTSNTQDVVYGENYGSTYPRIKELLWPLRMVLGVVFTKAVCTVWTCIGSVDCLRLRTVCGKEHMATNKPGLPPGVSPRSHPTD
jgi:hypothetical protein